MHERDKSPLGLRKYDIIIILLSIIGIILSFIFLHKKVESKSLVIYADGRKKVYSLQCAKFDVKTKCGTVKVKVNDGRVRIIESTCPDKWCTRMGPIDEPGEYIVCLPSKIFIIIEEKPGKDREVDAISR
ncbi:MAG: NusG domain II-containing protein [Candidatus Eremiobacteraeota bacterium]|nr:NusG domain II-containing protein [Candidatus Eremiobacteraeota bacterium]